jgi:hypothetical protein
LSRRSYGGPDRPASVRLPYFATRMPYFGPP